MSLKLSYLSGINKKTKSTWSEGQYLKVRKRTRFQWLSSILRQTTRTNFKPVGKELFPWACKSYWLWFSPLCIMSWSVYKKIWCYPWLLDLLMKCKIHMINSLEFTISSFKIMSLKLKLSWINLHLIKSCVNQKFISLVAKVLYRLG